VGGAKGVEILCIEGLYIGPIAKSVSVFEHPLAVGVAFTCASELNILSQSVCVASLVTLQEFFGRGFQAGQGLASQ
jgi:hypothetical protein